MITTNRNCIQEMQYSFVNYLTQAVDPSPDITMYRVSLGMRVKQLVTTSIPIIAIVEAPATQTIATLVRHVRFLSGGLDRTSDAGHLPSKLGFLIMKPQVGLRR